MKNDFQKMIDRAVEIRSKYSKTDPKEWGVDQVFMGLTKDIGELSKILMVYGGYRKDLDKNVKEALGHELSDVLYSILVIANKTGVDLEKGFWKTMNELNNRMVK